jgi:hypothetical protein
MLPTGGHWIVSRIVVWIAALIGLYTVSRLRSVSQLAYSRIVVVLVLLACVVDIGGLQGYYWANRIKGEYAGQLGIEPLRFAQVRSESPTWDAVRKNAILNSSPGGAYHAYFANVLQYDPCMPFGFVDIFPKGVHELVTARGAAPTQRTIGTDLLPPNDLPLMTVMGCNAPKIRMVSRAVFAPTENEIRNLIRSSSTLDQVVILKGTSLQSVPLPAGVDPPSMRYSIGSFNANRLDLDVEVNRGSAGGWLVYADAFDPLWKAYVNGRETPLLEANLAFKAIYVPEGKNAVSFKFENYRQKYAMVWLILVGICLSLCCIAGLGWQLLQGKENPFILK